MQIVGYVSDVVVEQKTKGDSVYQNTWVQVESSFRFKLKEGLPKPTKGNLCNFTLNHEWVRPEGKKAFVVFSCVGWMQSAV